jgi:hypothetical protein
MFYLISAPLNIGCQSKDRILTSTFDLGKLGANISLTPQSILAGCEQGETLFTTGLNGYGDTARSKIVDILETQLESMNILSDSAINDMLSLPDPAEQAGNVNMSDFRSFNLSALSLPSVSMDSLTDAKNTLKNSTENMTPNGLNSNLGNQLELNNKLESFNNAADAAVDPWTDWDVPYIVNTYIVTGAHFAVRSLL